MRNSLNIAQPNCRYLATRGSQRRRVAASEGGLEIAYSTLLEAAWQFRSNRSTSSATRTFALLLWKYGRSELVNPVWLDDLLGDAEDRPTPESLRAFRATGRQGINFARNVWHHPLLMPAPGAEFLIIDRKGPGNNLEEHWFAESERPILRA